MGGIFFMGVNFPHEGPKKTLHCTAVYNTKPTTENGNKNLMCSECNSLIPRSKGKRSLVNRLTLFVPSKECVAIVGIQLLLRVNSECH